MKELNLYIDESLFGGKSEEDIAQGAADAATIGELKKIAFDKLSDALKRISPFMPDFGSVKVGRNGFDIEMYTTRGRCPEFMLNCSTGVPLPFERLQTLDGGNGPKPATGTIIIENYKEKDFTKLFTKDCHLRCLELIFRHCPNLESLKGLPKNTQATNLYLDDCKNLKDISDLTPVLNVMFRGTSIDYDSLRGLSKNTIKMMQSMTIYLGHKLPEDRTINAVREILWDIHPNANNIDIDVW